MQWGTDHLASLGAVEIPRTEYLRRLDEALALPPCLGVLTEPRRSRRAARGRKSATVSSVQP